MKIEFRCPRYDHPQMFQWIPAFGFQWLSRWGIKRLIIEIYWLRYNPTVTWWIRKPASTAPADEGK